MSEWYDCPKCGATRENMCACPNPNCADGYPAPPKPDHVANKLVRLRGQVLEYMAELEARDVTKMTIHELIELRQAANGIQNSGIDANHAVSRMIHRWKKFHRPQELIDEKRYNDETSNRMSRPSEVLITDPKEWESYNRDQRARATQGLTYYQVTDDCRLEYRAADGTILEADPVAAPTPAILSAIDQTP